MGKIIKKLRPKELWFMFTALLLVAIFLYSKIKVNPLNRFGVILWKKIRTEGQTETITISPPKISAEIIRILTVTSNKLVKLNLENPEMILILQELVSVNKIMEFHKLFSQKVSRLK